MQSVNLRTPHVVIVGAGFGGLRAALALAKKAVRVTLVDQNNYHLFQPLLYQVATSTLAPDEIAYPIRSTLRGNQNLAFHQGKVEVIDLDHRCIKTDNGDLDYDYLVIAVGGETNYFGNEMVARNSFGLKDLQEATQLRNHVLQQFELAVAEPDPAKRQAMLTFVVVGGGPTGVESAGAISELIRTVLHKDYPNLDISEVRVILLEAMDKLLANFPESLGNWTVKVLHKKQVDVHFRSVVQDYDGYCVSLKDGTAIPARTLVWAAGVHASGLLDTLDLAQDRLHRVKVTPSLQVPEHPEVFVIGDAAFLEDGNGQPLPMVAPVAMQQAGTATTNIMHLINEQPVDKFTYHDPGIMATIGRNQAVAWIGRWKFHGFIAWLLWLGVHIFQLIGFRNRLAVLLDWAWSYLFYERASRLIGPS